MFTLVVDSIHNMAIHEALSADDAFAGNATATCSFTNDKYFWSR